MLFARLLNFALRDGSIRVIDSSGRSRTVGNGDAPVCTVRLHSRLVDFKLVMKPDLAVPEAYMNGTLTIEDGTLADFVEICARNYRHVENHPLFRFLSFFNRARFGQFNPIGKAQNNVAHHYDLSGKLYRLFLDEDQQYSCAYFNKQECDLDGAQLAKKRHLASKLLLKPNQKILDIGCGWGGLGLYLADAEDVDVKGVTLSREQQAVAAERAEEAGLADRVSFHLQDYREETQKYDRIISVGMFEHVGKRNYEEFFGKVQDLLADDGVMVLHSIGRFDKPSPINPFIRKYIFPGADLPALSEIMTAIEPLGLLATDIEVLRLHYAETLREWRERFMQNRDEAAAIYDKRFCRMWEMYLLLCEMGFRYQNLMVFQLQLTKSLEAVPITRDYMVDWERKQTTRENSRSRRAA